MDTTQIKAIEWASQHVYAISMTIAATVGVVLVTVQRISMVLRDRRIDEIPAKSVQGMEGPEK